MENVERGRAEAEHRQPMMENVFPYGDVKQQFTKIMVSLRVVKLVMQKADDSIFSDSASFTLSPFGRTFVTKNLTDMIKDECFGLIVITMSEKDKPAFLSHVIMKLMEMKKVPFDQLISVIDDLQPSVNEGKSLISMTIIDEYAEYLKSVEGELNNEEKDVQSSVMRKLSTLVQKGLVAVDQHGSFSLTKTGDSVASAFWDSVKGWFYFMRDAKLWTMDQDETGRHRILMLAEGKELAESMRRDFENDDERISKGVMLDDVDEHETKAVLPVHQIAKKEKDNKKILSTTIYIVDHGKAPFVQRVKDAGNALSGGAIVFGVLLMVFGFIMTGFYPVEGLGILVSSIFVMCFSAGAYQYTLRIVKSGRGRNKNEMKIMDEMGKQKLKEMQKNKDGKVKNQKSEGMKCFLCTMAICAIMILLVLSMVGS